MEKKMKKFAILLLSLVLIFGLTFAGCDIVKDLMGGGKESTDTPTPTTPTTPTPTTPTPTPPSSHSQSGYLNGPGDSYTFSVDAGTTKLVEVPFKYPEGSADFWVKVIGKDGTTVLGDFDLDEGEIIQLINGDVFYLTIYSRGGAGYWSTNYTVGGGTGGY